MSISITIIILTAIVSITAFNNTKINDDLIFYPPAITRRHQWYRFFTCGLLHADWAHLFFNMLSLYFFGPALESIFVQIAPMGKLFYILLYVSALFSSLLPTYLKNKDNYHYRSLGASGAVSAVIGGAVLFNPWAKINFFIPAILYIALFIGISAYLSKRGQDNINHDAHLWGTIYGIVFTLLLCYAYYPAGLEVIWYRLTNPTF